MVGNLSSLSADGKLMSKKSLFVLLVLAVLLVSVVGVVRAADEEGFEDFGLSTEEAGILGGFLALMMGFMVAVIIFSLIVYVYISLALMKIAKRTGTEPAWIAWIPIANIYLISKIAKMHWWPMLLLVAYFVLGFIPFVGIFIAMGVAIVFIVYMTIWQWKMFEAVGRPGWWVLLSFIPFVGTLIYFVLLGVAAWGGQQSVPVPSKSVR